MVAKTEHRSRSGCPVACALDIVGDHWTLLIVRNLMFLGVHEYKDMLAAEEQISSSILSERLKKLEGEGLVASVPHPASKRRKFYFLTPMGKDLIHVMLELVLWSNRHLSVFLDIPKEKKAFLERDPAGFKAHVLAELDAWERQFLNNERSFAD
ncbi:winged helix-turn-helix transcriptional regulator [Roseibium aggregatum]|uniref:Helix-turn-helix transcriptional regulator n=1 Tax=Roseibium aggregatum TaxID=187304 RepID=A0A939J4E7_9HYPH|nr:helix-turn-helix domain-containing protein [Roseibium aggregatum]MBN9671100.1 helix-turn-helix transcriptional regulator [Roseibium aggregatum]